MKSIRPNRIFILILLIGTLVNCRDETNGPSITDIQVITDSNVSIGDKLLLRAVNQDNSDITGHVDFYINSSYVPGHEYTVLSSDNIEVTARYGDIISEPVSVDVLTIITTLQLSVSKSTIKPNLTDQVTFNVTNQDEFNVTSQVKYEINGVPHDSHVFTTDQFGTIRIKAMYEDIQSNTVEIEGELNISSINLTARGRYEDGFTEIDLYALDQDSDTITQFVDFYVDDQYFDGHHYRTSDIGTITFLAKYQEIVSNEVSIKLGDNAVKKILIEEFTGEWCGWCPQAGYNIGLLMESNPNILAVAIHNGDPMQYINEHLIREQFDINAFPSAVYNRYHLQGAINAHLLTDQVFQPITDGISAQLQEEPHVGIAINSSIGSNNRALIDVNLSFESDLSDKLYITAYMTENQVIGNLQRNYFSQLAGYEQSPFYDEPENIEGFVHDHVLRKLATNVYGDPLPDNIAEAGTIFTLDQFSVGLENYNTENLEVIVFVHYATDSYAPNIINAQKVKLGSDISYGG